MGFLNIMGNSFGCSASGERLVSAARDGDLHEAKAILDCNPRLARYSTFGLRNSPLHHSAAQGHNEIVVLFLESGVDIDLRNASGQTALMQACQYGHWEVVQTLILFNANIHKTDYLNGGTAIHFAALNGHSRCIRLLLTDYVPSISNFWNIISNNDSTDPEISDCGFDESGLFGVISNPADGGVTALHMAALNGHAETVRLLLDLGGFVSAITVEDGTSVDLIGGGSTPLHYAAYGGNAMCCRLLIARGASLDAKNANGSTPLNVARSCHRIQLEDILSRQPAGTENRIDINPSPYLSLPLMSIMKIARESVCHEIDKLLTSFDPCVVCLERKCTVSTDGCGHEFCTRCALYLCSATTTSVACPSAGSIPCPLCRHPIISFSKLQSNATPPKKLLPRPSGLALGGICGTTVESTGDSSEQLYKQPSGFNCASITPSLGSSLFRSLSCHMCPGSSMRLNPILCLSGPVTEHSLVRCSRPRLHRSVSHGESRNRWLFSFNQYEETNSD